MRATIHQPDFMPWFGFFNKVAKSDILVVLDHVCNNPRNANLWTRRVKMLINGEPRWVSLPLNKDVKDGKIGIPLNEMTINIDEKIRINKTLKTIKMAYSSSPYYDLYISLIIDFFNDEEPLIFKRNMDFISKVIRILSIDTKIIYSSSLNCESNKNDLLIEILKKIGADIYLCGQGSSGYQDDSKFFKNGIKVEYNKFTHPIYKQILSNQFFPGLSIVDSLFCMEYNAISKFLKS